MSGGEMSKFGMLQRVEISSNAALNFKELWAQVVQESDFYTHMCSMSMSVNAFRVFALIHQTLTEHDCIS